MCTAVINDAEVVLITNNIEARRLQEEEVGDVPRILALPWADGEPAVQAQAELAGNAPLLEADCAEELQQLRSCLQGTQEQEAAQVAALCSSAVERAVLLIHPGMTEWEASGVLSGCAVANGLIPNVLFTPADEHIARYRHALSPYPLKKTMMLSMGAQKNGLYASITRFVSFGRPEEVFLSAQEKTCQVAAMLYSETRPGKQYGTLFAQLKRRYAKVGAGEQIALHHQGGMGGFQTRENRLTPDLPGQVQIALYLLSGAAALWVLRRGNRAAGIALLCIGAVGIAAFFLVLKFFSTGGYENAGFLAARVINGFFSKACLSAYGFCVFGGVKAMMKG